MTNETYRNAIGRTFSPRKNKQKQSTFPTLYLVIMFQELRFHRVVWFIFCRSSKETVRALSTSEEGSRHDGGLDVKWSWEQQGLCLIVLCTVTTASYQISSSIETEHGLQTDVLWTPAALLDRWLMWHWHTSPGEMTSSLESRLSLLINVKRQNVNNQS